MHSFQLLDNTDFNAILNVFNSINGLIVPAGTVVLARFW